LTRTFLVVICFFVFSCSGKKSVETTSSGKDNGIADNRIWDMKVNITDEGMLKAKFSGGYVIRDNLGNSQYSKNRIDSGLVIEFFDKGVRSGKLVSVKGDMNDLTELFSAWEDVVFTSEKGYVLYTDTLIWNRKEAKIFSDTDVMMIRDGRDTLYGEGFVTDDRFEAYEIKKPRGKAIIDNENVK